MPMSNMPTSKSSSKYLTRFARDFITDNRAAALATANHEGLPHVSVVYCVIGKGLEIYFSTRVEGRKYRNLMERSTVALAFYDEPQVQMIQLTGIAERLEDMQEEQKVMSQLMKLRFGDPSWPLPTVQMFNRGTTREIAIIKVTPSEMTYASFSTPETGRYKPVFQKII